MNEDDKIKMMRGAYLVKEELDMKLDEALKPNKPSQEWEIRQMKDISTFHEQRLDILAEVARKLQERVERLEGYVKGQQIVLEATSSNLKLSGDWIAKLNEEVGEHRQQIERLERICEIQQALMIMYIPKEERESMLMKAIEFRSEGGKLINEIMVEVENQENEMENP